MALDPSASQIRGLRMSVDATGTIITVGPGQCNFPTTDRLVTDNALTFTPASLPASSWLHVYAYLVSGVPTITASATAPSATYQGTARTMTGDTSLRYIGSLYIGTDSKIVRIRHGNPGSNANRVEWMGNNGIADAQAALLLGGALQTATIISAATVVPPTSTFIVLSVENASTLPIYLSNPDQGTVSATNYLRYVRAGNGGEYDLILDSAQRFSYVFGAGLLGLGVVNIRGIAYFYDR